MKIKFTETKIVNGERIRGKQKTVTLPFTHLTVRCVIIRRSDGAVLGALHRPDGRFAFPGGALKDGETPDVALERELEEEGIRILGDDPSWRERLVVDHFPGYNELALWYLRLADDVDLADSDELLEIRWVTNDQDPWYPGIQEKLRTHLQLFFPEHYPPR